MQNKPDERFIIAALVECVKELAARVDRLENSTEATEAVLERLRLIPPPYLSRQGAKAKSIQELEEQHFAAIIDQDLGMDTQTLQKSLVTAITHIQSTQ